MEVLFMDLNDNVIAKKRKNRFEQLTESTKIKLEKMNSEPPKNYLLKKQKKDSSYPEKGTIFEVISHDDIRVKGMVINNHVNGSLGKDLITIIFIRRGISISDKKEITTEDLLTEPQIVSIEMWNKGYAKNIGKYHGKFGIEYSFYDGLYNVYRDEYGNEKSEQKGVFGVFGMSTLFGVSRHIQTELIIDNII